MLEHLPISVKPMIFRGSKNFFCLSDVKLIEKHQTMLKIIKLKQKKLSGSLINERSKAEKDLIVRSENKNFTG